MALIDDVKEKVIQPLANAGWADLFAAHGLNIRATNLKAELLKQLPDIDRTMPGFEDFARDGVRGIEPASPSHSLLYHALASPNVVGGPGNLPLTKFPTLKQLDLVENLVFGVEVPTIAEVRRRVQNSKLSVVVFACDYRPSHATSHRRHADLMFSRTGIARVGTDAEKYEAELRGFVSFVDGQTKGVRVLPARYAAYLAVKRNGSETRDRPMRFQVGDDDRSFWVPVHKLFDGGECLADIGDDLELDFKAKHLNEKLRRVHLNLQNEHGLATGASGADLDRPPFRIRSGLARNGVASKYPKGVVVPVPHESLVEKASFQGEPATFPVPPGLGGISSSILLSGDRSAPEFIHARHKVNPDGSITDLNRFADVADRVIQGGYHAQHYLDFTADGELAVEIAQLAEHAEIEGFRAAYSLVCAPDFYPLVDQRKLTEWTDALSGTVPGLSPNVIWGIQPAPLCDERFPANLQFPDVEFDASEVGVTAVVGLADHPSGESVQSTQVDPRRHSHLPDDAAGVFDPGWDISTADEPDTGQSHLAAFGLGSPFPEDAKLCAAIVAFWPAVAPDITRTLEPLSSGSLRMRSVSPLTDQESGINGLGMAWDGIEPLRIVNGSNGEELEYASFAQTDYVDQALKNDLTVSMFGRITAGEYQDRVLATALFYKALAVGNIAGHGQSSSLMYSFLEIPNGDAGLLEAQQDGGLQLFGPVFGIKASSLGNQSFQNVGSGRVRVKVRRKIEVFVSPRVRLVLIREDGRAWKAIDALS